MAATEQWQWIELRRLERFLTALAAAAARVPEPRRGFWWDSIRAGDFANELALPPASGSGAPRYLGPFLRCESLGSSLATLATAGYPSN